MALLFALNQNSCKNFNLVEFIKYTKHFNGVELSFKKIEESLSNNVSLKDIMELLEIYDSKIFSIFQLKDISLSPDTEYKNKLLTQLNLMCDFCYRTESRLITVEPSYFRKHSDSNNIPKWRIINRTTKRLEEIAKIADKTDINIGFEFVSSSIDKISSISSLEDAKKVIIPLESQENLGFVIDTFHFAKCEANFNQLKDIKDSIFLIQLSDMKFDTSDDLFALKNSDRLIPGKGNYRFKEFLKYCINLSFHEFSFELSSNVCTNNLYKKISDYIYKNLFPFK